jgi:hypothetical protein
MATTRPEASNSFAACSMRRFGSHFVQAPRVRNASRSAASTRFQTWSNVLFLRALSRRSSGKATFISGQRINVSKSTKAQDNSDAIRMSNSFGMDDGGGKAREALREANSFPLRDGAIREAMREINNYREAHPHPSIARFCSVATRHLMHSLDLKSVNGKQAAIADAEEHFRGATDTFVRLKDRGEI